MGSLHFRLPYPRFFTSSDGDSWLEGITLLTFLPCHRRIKVIEICPHISCVAFDALLDCIISVRGVGIEVIRHIVDDMLTRVVIVVNRGSRGRLRVIFAFCS
jgi:hypothetical protein